MQARGSTHQVVDAFSICTHTPILRPHVSFLLLLRKKTHNDTPLVPSRRPLSDLRKRKRKRKSMAEKPRMPQLALRKGRENRENLSLVFLPRLLLSRIPWWPLSSQLLCVETRRDNLSLLRFRSIQRPPPSLTCLLSVCEGSLRACRGRSGLWRSGPRWDRQAGVHSLDGRR